MSPKDNIGEPHGMIELLIKFGLFIFFIKLDNSDFIIYLFTFLKLRTNIVKIFYLSKFGLNFSMKSFMKDSINLDLLRLLSLTNLINSSYNLSSIEYVLVVLNFI